MAEVVIKNCESVSVKPGRYTIPGGLLNVELDVEPSDAANAINWSPIEWMQYLGDRFNPGDLLDSMRQCFPFETDKWASDNYMYEEE